MGASLSTAVLLLRLVVLSPEGDGSWNHLLEVRGTLPRTLVSFSAPGALPFSEGDEFRATIGMDCSGVVAGAANPEVRLCDAAWVSVAESSTKLLASSRGGSASLGSAAVPGPVGVASLPVASGGSAGSASDAKVASTKVATPTATTTQSGQPNDRSPQLVRRQD